MYLQYISRGVEKTDKTVLEAGSSLELRHHVVMLNSRTFSLFFNYSITHQPTGSGTASICSNASMTLLTQPHVHVHYLQSPQVQSPTTSLSSLTDAAIATLLNSYILLRLVYSVSFILPKAMPNISKMLASVILAHME